MKAITQSADSGLSFDNAKSYVSATGLLAAGFLVAYNGLRLIKMQNNLIANLGLTAVAVAGAMMVGNPWIKLALIGVAAYAGVKTLSLAVAEVAAPGPTGAGGLSGFIPETVKSKIRSFLPSFGDIDGNDDFGDIYGDDFGNIDLDEPVNGFNSPSEVLLGEDENLNGASLLML